RHRDPAYPLSLPLAGGQRGQPRERWPVTRVMTETAERHVSEQVKCDETPSLSIIYGVSSGVLNEGAAHGSPHALAGTEDRECVSAERACKQTLICLTGFH